MSPAPTASVSAELAAVLRRLKLGQMLDTLPERLTLARQSQLPHGDFLEMVLTDEIARRDRTSATLRARVAHLDATMVAEAWDDTAKVTYDKAMWAELTTLRFVQDAANALILGPVGVGKTFLATALGHIACRRRYSVHFERADRLHKRLKPPVSTPPTKPRSANSCESTFWSWMILPCSASTPPRPPTSTNSSSNATAGPPPSSPPTANPPRCWP